MTEIVAANYLKDLIAKRQYRQIERKSAQVVKQ